MMSASMFLHNQWKLVRFVYVICIYMGLNPFKFHTRNLLMGVTVYFDRPAANFIELVTNEFPACYHHYLLTALYADVMSEGHKILVQRINCI